MLTTVTSSPPILRLTDVTKSFGPNRVLDGIELDLFPGTILGLVGPNAAGKTTLISILTGLLPPGSGAIQLDGQEVDFDRHPQRRKEFGLMLNGRLLVPELRPTEYFAFLASMYGLDRTLARLRAEEMAETLMLTAHMSKPIKQLSAGTQKKVEFIAALLQIGRAHV